MITNEIYRVCKTKEDFAEIKDFDDFESAYTHYRKDIDQYIAGKIVHKYDFEEVFFDFDKRKYPPRDQIIDMIENT